MDEPRFEFVGFGVRGYRSLYGTLRVLGPLKKVNLVAGQNNSGKSNFLRFASTFLASGSQQWFQRPTGLDQSVGPGVDNTFEFAIGFRLDLEVLRALTERVPYGQAQLERLLGLPAAHPVDGDAFWIRFTVEPTSSGSRQNPKISDALCAELAADTPPNDAMNLANGLTNQYNQSNVAQNISLVLMSLFLPLNYLPQVHLIDAFRQISNTATQTHNLISGAGLIQRLADLQRPDIDHQSDKQRFREINNFLKTVLDDPSADLDIPNNMATIHVDRNGLTLPLESLGTGIHQVIIIAAAATTVTDSIVCIEEPEVHLHPLLQRKLVRYLQERTSNRYIIATHSAHLLDYLTSAVYHVHLGQQGTEIQRASSPQAVADLCADLGYRPSDLLQANSVLWVEGPSDRLYIRAWLALLEPDLVEGIHFSIMFYGGRLLNHLTARDPEVHDFISLRRLNRQSAIVIDSDKAGPRHKINDTKRRVRDEFDDPTMPGFAWVTDCRTIENYIREAVKRAGLAISQPKLHLASSGGKWENPLSLKVERSAVDKIKLAQATIGALREEDLDVYDLRRRIRQLAAFIRTANGL